MSVDVIADLLLEYECYPRVVSSRSMEICTISSLDCQVNTSAAFIYHQRPLVGPTRKTKVPYKLISIIDIAHPHTVILRLAFNS